MIWTRAIWAAQVWGPIWGPLPPVEEQPPVEEPPTRKQWIVIEEGERPFRKSLKQELDELLEVAFDPPVQSIPPILTEPYVTGDTKATNLAIRPLRQALVPALDDDDDLLLLLSD